MRSAFAISILFILSCNSGIDYPEGGYDYVKDYKDEDTNFYFLPVRDTFSLKDSFDAAFDSEYIYSKLGLPNISLKPQKSPVFRLITWEGEHGPIALSLFKNELIVRKSISHSPCHFDSSKLTKLELEHYTILDRRFPLTRDHLPERLWLYYDSITRIYRELLDPAYYYSLLRKGYCDNLVYRYKDDTIKLTRNQYKNAIDSIESAAFWNLPVRLDCKDGDCTGSSIYILEANTPHRYNYVSASTCCRANALSIPFAKACQQLIKLAGLDDKITLDWNAKVSTLDFSDSTDPIIQDVELEPIKTKKANKNK